MGDKETHDYANCYDRQSLFCIWNLEVGGLRKDLIRHLARCEELDKTDIQNSQTCEWYNKSYDKAIYLPKSSTAFIPEKESTLVVCLCFRVVLVNSGLMYDEVRIQYKGKNHDIQGKRFEPFLLYTT